MYFSYRKEVMIQSLFFELIKVSVGAIGNLSRTPSEAEWGELYAMAKKQSLVGICFAGVHKLRISNASNTSNLSEQQYFTWMGMAAKVQQRNEVVNQRCIELQARLSADGISSSILKGQSVGALYPSSISMLRQSGDIDIYVDCGMKCAREYAEMECGKFCRFDYKNLHWPIYSDTEVEMHYRVDVIMDVLKHGRMQSFWDAHTDDIFGGVAILASGQTITCPTLQLNSFYILFHCYRHLFEGGVGLRQVMDYYFVLKAQNEQRGASASKAETMKLVKDFGMKRFTSAMMWIMHEVFGMSREMLLCDPDEKEGRYILKQVMMGGNFGHHDETKADLSNKWKSFWYVNGKTFRFWRFDHWAWFWSPLWRVYHFAWRKTKGFE